MTPMTHSILFLLALLALAPKAGAQPAVTGVTGTVTHGQTVTVAGSNFGTKTVAAPIKYDDFSNLAEGQQVSANGWLTQGFYKPVASSALVRPGTPYGRNARAHFNGTVPFTQEGDTSNFYVAGKSFVKAYLDFWFYADPSALGAAKPQNIKIFRLHQNAAGDPNAYFATTEPPTGTEDSLCAGRDGTPATEWPGCAPSTLANNGNIPDNAFPGTDFWGKWHHFQIQAAAGSGNSFNGTWIVYIDGRLRYNRPANIQMMRTGFSSWTEAYFGNYIRSEEWSGDAYFHWDSVYVDNTWSRVEIGDQPTYSASQHREIQIPTAWANGSLTMKVNAGSFASGSTAYVYVTNSNGVTNTNGHPITIGGTPPPPPPPTCTAVVNPTSLSVVAAGEVKTVTATWTDPSCTWTASTATSWLTVTPAASTGTGTVTVTAAVNPNQTTRMGSATVAGTIVNVIQAAAGAPPPPTTVSECWKFDRVTGQPTVASLITCP